MTKPVRIGNVIIGGGNPVAIQSMTSVSASDTVASIRQIGRLAEAGCDIVRVAVLNESDAKALSIIKREAAMPLVADIHFDALLAVAAIENGADKIRINPGNIGGAEKLKLIADAAKAHNIPIRIGVNAGSLEKEVEARLGRTAAALAESAVRYAKFFEELNFFDLVLSVKSSSVAETVEANRLLSSMTDYPLHIGVTESGCGEYARIKSAIGIGSLLLDGIGDTIRVSLTDDIVREIEAAKDILRATGRLKACEVISCPTCGRCQFDLIKIAEEVNEMAKGIAAPLKIAVMGCVVNGPGEARHADIGIAGGGGGKVALFRHGKMLKTVNAVDAIDELRKEIALLLKEKHVD